jgi:hypothetical protein
MWKDVKDAPTLPEVRVRLSQIEVVYPTSKSYCDFLWTNVNTWATCVFTWMLTFGLQASSLQEGLHAQLKSITGNRLIALTQAPALFRKAMSERTLKRDAYSSSSSVRLKTTELKNSAREKGYGNLVDKVDLHLNDWAIKVFLEELRSAAGMYVVALLSTKNDVNEAIASSRNTRGASSARFQVLADTYFENTSLEDRSTGVISSTPPSDQVVGDSGVVYPTKTSDVSVPEWAFYKVHSNRLSNRSYDVVCVTSNGSLACTRPAFATSGFPDKCILSVFCAGYLAINVLRHFCSVYHRHQDALCLEDETISSLSVTADHVPAGHFIIPVTHTASFEWCVVNSQ